MHALAAGTPQDTRLRGWLAKGEPLGMSTVAWAEFLCGPVEAAGIGLLDHIVTERAPFGEGEAVLAAQLFNVSGQRRGSLADCMVAAAAIRAGVALATDNPKDFRRFEPAGLRLAAGDDEPEPSGGTGRTSGLLAREPVPAYGDFRSARALLSSPLPRKRPGRSASRR